MLARVLLARRCLGTSSRLTKGHSKWQNIQKDKQAGDAARSKAINIFMNKIRTAVNQSGGPDVRLNKSLANVLKEYKAESLPMDTWNRCLQRLKDKPEQTHYFDVIGPSGSFFVVETLTDSKSRMDNTLRKYMNNVGHFRHANGTILSTFNETGVLLVSSKRSDGGQVEMDALEALCVDMDCEDLAVIEEEDGDKLELICPVLRLQTVSSRLIELGYSVECAEVQWRSKHTVILNQDDAVKVERFYRLLQQDGDIKQIFDNLEPIKATPYVSRRQLTVSIAIASLLLGDDRSSSSLSLLLAPLPTIINGSISMLGNVQCPCHIAMASRSVL